MDIQKIQGLLENRNINTNIFIFILCISIFQILDIKIIVSIGVFIFIIINYNDIMKIGSGNKMSGNKMSGNKMSGNKMSDKGEINKQDISDDMYYNTKVHDLLVQLQDYKKYNKISYKEGVIYMRKFFKTIHILEKDAIHGKFYINKHDSKQKQLQDKLNYENKQIKNYNQYFENALIYLKTAINHFQSITISLPERGFIKGLKYGDYESTKKMNQLGILCKEIYNECYYILQNMSITFNKEWTEHPNIYTKEIDMNTDRVEQYNEKDEVMWSLY